MIVSWLAVEARDTKLSARRKSARRSSRSMNYKWMTDARYFREVSRTRTVVQFDSVNTKVFIFTKERPSHLPPEPRVQFVRPAAAVCRTHVRTRDARWKVSNIFAHTLT